MVNVPDSNGTTPFHNFCKIALRLNQADLILASLLEHGADITRALPDGQSPVDLFLSAATENGNFDANLEKLLEATASHIEKSEIIVPSGFLTEPLIWALEHGRYELSELLIDAGADVSQRLADQSKTSPLLKRLSDILNDAIVDGDYDICEILIEAGLRTDTGHDGCYGCTPLITSLQMEDDDIAHMLVRNSVVTGEMCAEAKYPGYTPIHLASRDESFLDSLELLLSEPSSEGDLHLSSPVHPLHFATTRSNAAGLRCLLEHLFECLRTTLFRATRQTSCTRIRHLGSRRHQHFRAKITSRSL